nr:YitT family protein [Liquorilactobacillus vini]
MDELQKIVKRHQYVAKASTAFIYGILVSIAMNFFWTPGKIYSSGVTGLAQLVATLTKRYFPMVFFHPSVALLLFVLNLPLFVLAWQQIGHRFTFLPF